MKIFTRISLLVIVAAFVFTACRKEHEAVTKVITVTLNANETYNYNIPPTGDKDDVLQIVQPAAHALTNTLGFTNNTASSSFQYTPALNYTGTDEVHVATVEDHHPNNGGSGFGNCQGGGHHGHHDEGTTYIFKIIIGDGNKPG